VSTVEVSAAEMSSTAVRIAVMGKVAASSTPVRSQR
jgi:hypothetical protein